MSSMLEKANQFIQENRRKVYDEYRPVYHAVAPFGWINDPNGFCYIGEACHLFYQHNPYEAEWSDMHWGHWRSNDLVHWEDLPVIMAPDCDYDSAGCFSGSALPDGKGGAHIFYTGVHAAEDGLLQEQCLAFFNGEIIEKYSGNPVIPRSLVPDVKPADCRDPKIFRAPGGYRVVLAARKDKGQLISLFSEDLLTWRYDGTFADTVGTMPECPDFFTLEGKEVVLYSAINAPTKLFTTSRPVLVAVGTTDEEMRHFNANSLMQLDYGTDFYAAQTTLDPKNQRIMIGWMSSWQGQYPTSKLGHGWAGMMTIPRILTIQDGCIHQKPPETIFALRQDQIRIEQSLKDIPVFISGAAGRHILLDIDAKIEQNSEVELRFLQTGDEYTALIWRNENLCLDRTNSGHSISSNPLYSRIEMPCRIQNDKIHLQVFVDGCAIEIFVGEGEYVMSALAFPINHEDLVSLRGHDAQVTLDCWQMKGKENEKK